MRRIALTLLVIALGLCGVSAFAAGIDAGKLAAVKKAASDFLALAKGSETSGQPPRGADPKAKALLDTVFDTSVLKTAQPLPSTTMGEVSDWLLQVVKVGSIYILAGTGYSDFSQLGSIDAAAQQKLQQQITKNTVAFAPEIGRYFDAQLAVTEALVWSVSADMAARPNEFKSAHAKKGVGQMRAGLANTLTGVVTTFPTEGLSDQWRRDRLPAMAAIAPKAAALLLPAQRKSVHDVALQVAAEMSDASVKSGLTAFAKAFAG
jgi:hypothetical protein